jgi:hypothetical protein
VLGPARRYRCVNSGSLAKPYRSFCRSAGRRQAIADIFFGLTIVATLRPDPIARCQRGQQRPTLSASAASELIEPITPTIADRLSDCRNLYQLRGASAGEA